MNRSEKITKALKLDIEIRELEDFMKVLEYENTISKQNRLSSAMVKVKVQNSFLGLWNKNTNTEIKIPERMTIEIAAKCKVWIDELNRQADELIN